MAITLNEEQVRWILYGGPTLAVASRSASLRPSIGQAIGCRLEAGSSRFAFFLLEPRNRDVVIDLRAGREVAVVITRGSTTRSLQIKSNFAREVPMTPDDEAQVANYLRAVMVTAPGPIAAFEMEMMVAFDQTPGPRAGEPLPSGA